MKQKLPISNSVKKNIEDNCNLYHTVTLHYFPATIECNQALTKRDERKQ